MNRYFKSAVALTLTAVMLCGCTDTADSNAESQSSDGGTESYNRVVFPTTDHTLQDIQIFLDSRPQGTDLPGLKKDDEYPHLYFKPIERLSGFLLRNWQATDISSYKENGCVVLDIKGSGTAKFDVGFGNLINGNYSASTITHTEENLSNEWKTVEIPIKAIDSDLVHIRDFVIGNAEGEFFVANIRLTSKDSETNYPLIKINQCGYRPDSEKTAVFSAFGDNISCNVGDEFEVVSAADNSVAYSGRLTLITELDNLYSGEAMLCADFTGLENNGRYYLRLKNSPEEKSPAFDIGDDVYDKVLTDTMRYFYYQRANAEITAEFTNGIERPDITPEDFSLPLKGDKEGKNRIDVSGGWYDAGDVGKYVVPGATAVNTLLWAYQLYPEKFTDNQNNIPESGNSIPDILDEARYELDFFLRMQDKESGGFYMKVKALSEDDNQKNRVVWQCTANTTADASAILAFASTVYREFDSA